MENYSLFGTITQEQDSEGGQLIKLLGKLPPLDLGAVTKIANSPSRDSCFTRSYYSYPAKFQSQLPEFLISIAAFQIFLLHQVLVQEYMFKDQTTKFQRVMLLEQMDIILKELMIQLFLIVLECIILVLEFIFYLHLLH